ncbi:aminoglycoside phosphotransferase [Marinobacter salinus]|uniref:Aminoglycoside phosphotransferase n=1 Tax=Marinobacter salinus TaxID=1874317 RepID=A0A1D9GQ67_9GAMM|nr:phosphotransferase [Marinobacter salinus]AOY89786.1 aminoglycoside phosphotransferase [Marinobacter salinus]
MDIRLRLLTEWVRQFPGFEQTNVEPVSGDASFRRYFRVSRIAANGMPESFIVMDAPPEHENCGPFVAIARHWHQHGVAVPDILQQDLAQGFLLIEDFGDQLMLGQLNGNTADTLYRGALSELIAIQQLSSPVDYPLPPYDTALLDREMALFPDWLLEQYLGLDLSNTERALLDTTFAILRESALAQPEVTVHRDYHSRNLLIRAGSDRPGVIDFQDAVTGPVTYDAASLLKDCYIEWPEEQVCQWLEVFREGSIQSGLHRADKETFRQWFELMGMQRHLKAAGIFARLALRDGKHGYLNDIPRTVGYLLTASSRQPALRHFHEWLSDTVMPEITHRIGPAPDREQ